MKICPHCQTTNPNDAASFCICCGADISKVTAVPPSMPLVYTPPYISAERKSVDWTDVFAVISFIAAIIGLFWGTFILLPIALIISLIGFWKSTLKGLCAAGIIISIIGLIVKICVELHRAGLLPEWLTRGIF